MKVKIDQEVYKKIMFWVNRASTLEVSGLGMVKVEGDTLRVTSAMLLPQTNQATHTEITAEAVAKAMYELRNEEGLLKFWWHSHVDMGVFWSGTDRETIEELGDQGWILATVFNKKRELRSAFYSKDGMTTPCGNSSLFLDELETEIEGETFPAEWEAEYTKNVTTQSISYGNYGGSDYGWGYGGSRYLEENSTTPPPVPKKPQKIIVDADGLDDFGFDKKEREFLAKEGFDFEEIDWLTNEDFTPNEIMRLAESGILPPELHASFEMGLVRDDILKELTAIEKRTDQAYDDFYKRYDQ